MSLSSHFRPAPKGVVFRVVIALITTVIMLAVGAPAIAYLANAPAIHYEIRDESLIVEGHEGFITRSRQVPIRDISSANKVALHGGRRTSGTALGGYCAGDFDYPGTGPVWQVTDCSSAAVQIDRASGEKIVISPYDSDSFLRALQERSSGVFQPSVSASGRNIALYGPAFGSVLIIITINLLAFLAPRMMHYRVVGGHLYANTLFARKQWDIAQMRARPYYPERWLRVMGTGMPGYFTGWFRLDGVTAWVAGSQRDGVLLEPANGKPVFLTPEDRDGFLEALRQAGAEVSAGPARSSRG